MPISSASRCQRNCWSKAGQQKACFGPPAWQEQNILRATVRSQIAGWLVSATVPVSYVEASRKRGQFFAAAMMGTALALGAVLAYLFGGFMARPLDAATTAAAAVGLGKPVEPLEIAAG